VKASLLALLLPMAVLAATPAAAQDSALLAAINEIRAEGCGRKAGVDEPLRRDARLDEAARALADGRGLKESVKSAGYAATEAAILEGSGSAAGIGRALEREGCKDVANPRYRDVGIALRDGKAWILLAAPLAPPAAGDSQAVGARVLALVNEARSSRRRCGWTRFEAVPPLTLSAALGNAALAHARDMAARGAMGHAGSDGSSVADRATRAGYRWRTVGENVATGQASAEEVVAGWLASPRHCANVMSADFAEMGVAFATGEAGAGVFWAQVFGTAQP
jgi:uncharacterized protein YkwD